MTIEAEFEDLMLDTIAVQAPGAKSFHGVPTYGATTSYRARVVRENRMVRADSGDEVVSRSRAYIFGAPGITPEYRITLPDGTSPPILSVDRYPDENGAHHETIYFGG